jgi:hypothetical protein
MATMESSLCKRSLHKGPLTPHCKHYLGSTYNVQVQWQNGGISWEPLHRRDGSGMWKEDPTTAAAHAQKHGLIDTTGWKLQGLKSRVKAQKGMIRMANQTKLHSFRTAPVYMFGVQMPRNCKQAVQINVSNKNLLWQESAEKKLSEINACTTFIDKGVDYQPGSKYKLMQVDVMLPASMMDDARQGL